MRVFISVAMEGIGGVVSSDQTLPTGKDYGYARELMAGEANAAVMGALDAGASSIVVADGHHQMRNLLPGDLKAPAELLSGSFRPRGMMEGLDPSFDAAVFVGYPAKVGTVTGVLNHTYYPRGISRLTVNGKEVGNAAINAYLADYFGVPVVLVTGDLSLSEEVRETLGPEVRTVVTKRGISRFSAVSLHPEVSQRAIRKETAEALAGRTQIRPRQPKSPAIFEVEFTSTVMADIAMNLEETRRVGGMTIEFKFAEYPAALEYLLSVITLAKTVEDSVY